MTDVSKMTFAERRQLHLERLAEEPLVCENYRTCTLLLDHAYDMPSRALISRFDADNRVIHVQVKEARERLEAMSLSQPEEPDPEHPPLWDRFNTPDVPKLGD